MAWKALQVRPKDAEQTGHGSLSKISRCNSDGSETMVALVEVSVCGKRLCSQIENLRLPLDIMLSTSLLSRVSISVNCSFIFMTESAGDVEPSTYMLQSFCQSRNRKSVGMTGVKSLLRIWPISLGVSIHSPRKAGQCRGQKNG